MLSTLSPSTTAHQRAPSPAAREQKAEANLGPYISKSTYLWGLQCPKLLWTRYNHKHRIPPPSLALQAIFDQGHEVGEVAKRLFPDGVEVGVNEHGLQQTICESHRLLKLRKPLFEPALVYDGAYARADILVPMPNGAWDIVEVKSTAEVKEIHLSDLAFQHFCYSGAGLKIRRCFIMHVDRGYVRHGTIKPRNLFQEVDVTDRVTAHRGSVRDNLEQMKATIRSSPCPPTQIGRRCEDPYTCPLRDQCWASLPKHNVFTLYRGGNRRFELFGNGIKEIFKIPDDFGMSELQKIQYDAVRLGEPHVNRIGLAYFLQELKYPLSFLDFETFATAIPLFDGLDRSMMSHTNCQTYNY